MAPAADLLVDEIWDVIVIGAGAAGLMAAERSASRGLHTLLLEKNRKPGVKILMSGGTRCNVTHNTDTRGIVAAFGKQGKFLHSALSRLSPRDVVTLLEGEGVPTKVESTGKIFPVSDTAVDIQQALLSRLQRSGAKLALGKSVQGISGQSPRFKLKTASGELVSRNVIVTCGGKSYPGCGTTGDGYEWARQFGHAIVPTVPSLAPLACDSAWLRGLQGLTLTDVELSLIIRSNPEVSDLSRPDPLSQAIDKPKILDKPKKNDKPPTIRGSIVLTHFGISGPAAMNLSRFVSYAPIDSRLQLLCDFVPSITEENLFQQLRSECQSHGKRQISSLLGSIVFQRLADSLLDQIPISGQRQSGEASNKELHSICGALKRQPISLSGTLGFAKAEVTAGGVALDEVDSSTMQSKLVPGLYFAGEILDLDGPIGGYNFQAAFSTGWLAGLVVADVPRT